MKTTKKITLFKTEYTLKLDYKNNWHCLELNFSSYDLHRLVANIWIKHHSCNISDLALHDYDKFKLLKNALIKKASKYIYGV